MLEIEAKYSGGDWSYIEKTLAGWQAVSGDIHTEADIYWNAPDRDFAQTGEAFRLRQMGDDNYLTYKGPKRASTVKTREEIELAIHSGPAAREQMLRLLGMLGYRIVAVVTKQRRSFSFSRAGLTVQVCLDQVEEVGRYIEIEVLAESADLPAAESVIASIAADLRLTEMEPRSYLRMLLQNRELP